MPALTDPGEMDFIRRVYFECLAPQLRLLNDLPEDERNIELNDRMEKRAVNRQNSSR